MVTNSPIKFLISLAEPANAPMAHGRPLSVFPSYFSKFTGISFAHSRCLLSANSFSISVSPIKFSPVSRSNWIV